MSPVSGSRNCQMLISTKRNRFLARFADCGLCVCVFTDLSWTDPGCSAGLYQASRSKLESRRGEAFPLGKRPEGFHPVKRHRKKRQGSPLGKYRRASVISLINKLNVSVIVSRLRHVSSYYSGKPQYQTLDKENMETSTSPPQSCSLCWGKIRSKTKGCKTMPLRNLGNSGIINR